MTHEDIIIAITNSIDHRVGNTRVEGTAAEFDEQEAELLLERLLAAYDGSTASPYETELLAALTTARAEYQAAVAAQPGKIAALVAQLSRSIRVLEGELFDGLATRLARYPGLEDRVLALDPSVPITTAATVRARAGEVLGIADRASEIFDLSRQEIAVEAFESLRRGLQLLDDAETHVPTQLAIDSLQSQIQRLQAARANKTLVYAEAKRRAEKYLEYLNATP